LKNLVKSRIPALYPFGALVALLISVSAFAEPCPKGQHWDEVMKMCMPDDAPPTCPPGTHWSAEEDQCVADVPNTGPHDCGANGHWDDGMHMCMPNGDTTLGFHINQYLVGITESGPRGRTALSAPNMFMLTFQQKIAKCDSVKVQWMGTTDKWTVPTNGTPELLQTGEANQAGVPYVDAQHPHSSPVMGLTFAEVHCFGKAGQNAFTISFAPRGEATAGPEAFMHRPSAEGNPNVPLSHHLQDVFHIMSTVLAAKLDIGKWSIEGSIFSGQEPSPAEVNLDIHRFDSYGVRVDRKLNDHFTVGASAASVLEKHRVPLGQTPENPTRTAMIASWLYTDHQFKGGSINTSTIYGRGSEEGYPLNSFLEELKVNFGEQERDHVFSRLEVLQRTPDQLEVNIVGDGKHPEWVKAFTLGYERNLGTRGGATFYGGSSVTRSFVPTDFKATYGVNPLSAEIHLRITFIKNRSWSKGTKLTPLP
jgi:hypothetical protein